MSHRTADTLSLFSGMGGLDLSARLAGLKVGLATDHDPAALEVLGRGLATPALTSASAELVSADLIERMGSPPRYVIGGPPCGPFSHAGFWIEAKRNGLDPAAHCVDDFARIVLETRPAAFCMENVPGLAFKNHKMRLESFRARLRRGGYSVSTQILRASDFGTAQARRRLFIVGVHGGPRFTFPAPLCVERSSGWAIADLAESDEFREAREVPSGSWADLIPLVPPGENYLHFTERRGYEPPIFRYRGRYWSFLLKLHPERPAPTLPAQRVTFNGPFHWRNRHLRVRELARLQGFPDWYPLATRPVQARLQIGNAVPPLFGAQILWSLRRHLGDTSEAEPEVLTVAGDDDASVFDVMEAMTPPK